MLMPEERSKAIELLTLTVRSSLHYDQNKLDNIIRHGHKGFAAYSDLELMRACTSLAKKNNSFELQNFISTIAADKFMLE